MLEACVLVGLDILEPFTSTSSGCCSGPTVQC